MNERVKERKKERKKDKAGCGHFQLTISFITQSRPSFEQALKRLRKYEKSLKGNDMMRRMSLQDIRD